MATLKKPANNRKSKPSTKQLRVENAKRQAAYREKQTKLGRKRVVIYVTANEAEQVKKWLASSRKPIMSNAVQPVTSNTAQPVTANGAQPVAQLVTDNTAQAVTDNTVKSVTANSITEQVEAIKAQVSRVTANTAKPVTANAAQPAGKAVTANAEDELLIPQKPTVTDNSGLRF